MTTSTFTIYDVWSFNEDQERWPTPYVIATSTTEEQALDFAVSEASIHPDAPVFITKTVTTSEESPL